MSLAAINVLNGSQYRREGDFFRCVVPFARGTASIDNVHVVDEIDNSPVPVTFLPFAGAAGLWSDGSLRYALAEGYIPAIDGYRTRKLLVEPGRPTPLAEPQNLYPKYPKYPILDYASARMLVGSRTETAVTTAEAPTSQYGRFGPFWFHAHLDVLPGRSIVYWYLTIGFCDPSSPEYQYTQIEDLELFAPEGSLIAVYWASLRGAVQTFNNGRQKWTLTPAGTVWGNGQRLMWRGVLTAEVSNTGVAVTEFPLRAKATNWSSSRSYGPFGFVPELPVWMTPQSGRDWINRQILTRRPNSDLWRASSFCCGKVPGSTGDQGDFGVIQGWPGAVLGAPEYDELMLPEVLQEACRPNGHRNADGTPFKASEHPNCVFWMEDVHYNATVSPDRLKNPIPSNNGVDDHRRIDPAIANALLNGDMDLNTDERGWLSQNGTTDGAYETHGWAGYDRQHNSRLYLVGLYMQTGDPQLKMLCEDAVQCILAEDNTSPPKGRNWPTTERDASRAVGRMLLTESWLYLVTGDSQLEQRVRDRIRLSILPQWDGVNSTGARPLMIFPTDSRQPLIPPGSPAQWPWQEALAVVGLEAAHRTFGIPEARTCAFELASTLVIYGWQERGLGDQIANCIVYNNGYDVDRNDPSKFMPADGTDFAIWALGAIRLAVEWNIAGASDILSGLEMLRRPPSGGGFDRWGTWGAVAP